MLREVGLVVLVVLLVKVVGSVASVSEGFGGRGSGDWREGGGGSEGGSQGT